MTQATGHLAVYQGPGQPFELREYPVPEMGPEDILVKVHRANICGSDLHLWRGLGPGIDAAIPQVLGHEMMGSVVALGRSVTHDNQGQPLWVGDRVVYSYFRPCGQCPACLHGDAACPYRYRDWLGQSTEVYPHFRAAFGQYYFMYPGHWVFRVPDELPDDLASSVNCALSEVVYGLWRVGVTLGDTVVIQGAGGLGLFATAVARGVGAGRIIVLDEHRERLELAGEMGADHLLNVTETSPEERVARVRQWSPGGYGADVVAELTGDPDAVREGVDMLRPGGRYLWIGNINLGQTTSIDPAALVRLHRSVVAVIGYPAWTIPRALDLLQRTGHRYPFHKIITHTFKLTEINEALRFAEARRAIRVTLDAQA